MKKTAAIISFITVLTVLFSSCGRKDYGADGLAFRLLNLYDSLPPCSQFIKNGEEYSPGYISPEDFSFLYTGKREKLPEWDLIDSFRLIISDSTEFFEIHVIKVRNSTDAEQIVKLAERRQAMLELHNKEDGDFPAKHADIFARGRYIVLLATYDNESAIRMLKRRL